MTRSFVQAHGTRTGRTFKIGLYTSPHLKHMRERIQIGNEPISKALFTKHLFEVWDSLSTSEHSKQTFFQLLALVAARTFIAEKVDLAIFETHHGGAFDSTNMFPKPVATGITEIGVDHIAQLGPTIENIAWHKAGIFKSGSPAFSVIQEPTVAAMLQRRSFEIGNALEFVNTESMTDIGAPVFKAPVQMRSAALAFRLADAFLTDQAETSRRGSVLNSEDLEKGVENLQWAGRFQVIKQEAHNWYIDGAHNEMSVPHAADWFAREIQLNERSEHSGSLYRELLMMRQTTSKVALDPHFQSAFRPQCSEHASTDSAYICSEDQD